VQLNWKHWKQLDHPHVSFIIYGLAVWRLAYMLTQETGPFMLFTKLRTVTGIEHDASGYPNVWPTGNVLSCLKCTSVWMALLALFMPRPLLAILAGSSLAIIVNKVAQDG
jgi:hypothetical protein